MAPNLLVTLIQSNLHWENIEANLNMFSQKIATISTTDIIVLPETFTTGFSMNPMFAEKENGAGVSWMKKTAAQKNCIVTGSLMIEDEGRYYNRLYWVNPDGSFSAYNKHHLFCISDEPKFFTAGNERLIVSLNGWNICPLICYDLRFPAWARNLHAQYDVLLYVANWPQRRNTAWSTLLPARAIENQAYVVGVNRVGTDEKGVAHTGNSMVIDMLGNQLYHKENEEDIFTAQLNYQALQEVRAQLPFLNDADEFVFNHKQKFKTH